jgi:hypothetical protein
MSLTSLPQEIQIAILFKVVLANSRMYITPQVIISDITPYILASRPALHCWSANRRVILHRVAKVYLASREVQRRRSRRNFVLARLRMLVWRAAWMAAYEEADAERSLFEFMNNSMDIQPAYLEALSTWLCEKRFADYWSIFLRR